mgnify:CR=1 FL=1
MNCALKKSFTLKYLTGELEIPTPTSRRRSSNYIEIKGATQNNLKGIDVKFPLGIMTAVTGVSGSGKSTLVNEVLYKTIARELNGAKEKPGKCKEVKGIENIDEAKEPLYTTKPNLERSGMGFTIMESFMDEVTVSSIKDEGTKVVMTKKINLPE